MSTHERRHVPSHVPFQQRDMTVHVTFFNMARPLWLNPSSAIAQGYAVSTHKRSDNMRCVKEIDELVIRKVSAQFSTWRGPLARKRRVQCFTVMLSVHTNTLQRFSRNAMRTNETGPLPLCTFSVMGLSMCSSLFSESSPVRSKSDIINELSGFSNSVPTVRTVRCSYTSSSWHGHTGHAYCICFVGKH